MLRKSERPKGRHESPANSKNNSSTTSLADRDNSRSNTSSPLFGTEPIPDDDNSRCPYCRKEFRKPRVLDCLHSMCEDCIIAQLDGRREHKSVNDDKNRKGLLEYELEAPKVIERPTPPGVIRCPICSQESHVGNDVRYVHGMLLDYVKMAEVDDSNGTMQIRCRACKSDQPAIAVCQQCQSDLCCSCVQAHGVMKLFEGHDVTTYEEMEKRGTHADTRAVLCTNHAYSYKYLCAICETLACKQCLELEHVHHKVIEITDLVIGTIRKEVSGMVEKTEARYNNFVSELNNVPDHASQLNSQYEVAKYRLEAYFEELNKEIENYKQKKMEELEEARQIQEKSIEELYRKLNVNEGRILDAFAFTKRLLTKANGIEMIASRKKVIEQLNKLSHALPTQGYQVELEFQPLLKKQIDSHLSELCGTILVGGIVKPSVKELSSVSDSFNNRALDDWNRAPNVHSNGLGAIGGERKKNQINSNGNHVNSSSTNGSQRPTNAETFGWPPSSNPPEMTTSPPPPQPQANNLSSLIGSVNTNTINQQLNALPNINTVTTNLTPELMALAAARNADFAALASNTAAQASLSGTKPSLPMFLFQQPGAMNGIQNNQELNQILSTMAFQRMQLQQNQGTNIHPQLNANNLLNMNIEPLLLNMNNLNIGSQTRGNVGPIGSTSTNGNENAVPNLSASQNVSGVLPQRVNELKVHSVFGTSQQGSTIRELHCPSGFCLSENDDILIADTNNHRVIVCGPPHPWKIGRPGTDDGQLCFPRKVICLKSDPPRYVVLDKGGDGKSRAQVFEVRGEFVKRLNMMALVPRGGIEVSAATATPNGGLLLVDSTGFVYSIDVDVPRVNFYFDASAHLGEASDVAMSESNIYITDFKHHCVQVFTSDGKYIRKMGEPSQTPYPIGIDVAKSGEILVADTHGNHLHVVVFNADGSHQHSFTHNEFRLSRCVGLRIAKSGHIVTLCKHNHTLFVFKPLVLPNGAPVPQPVPQQATPHSLITKFP